MKLSRITDRNLLRRQNRAFTLVETVIAVALLAMILLGAFGLMVSAYTSIRRTEETLYVNRLLETALEMTRNLSFADIAGDSDGDPAGYAAVSPVPFNTASTLLLGDDDSVLYGKGEPQISDPSHKLNLADSTGEMHFELINDDLYKVTAVVTFTPYQRQPLTRSVTTYVARNGINRR